MIYGGIHRDPSGPQSDDMPRRESESQVSLAAGTTSSPSTLPRRGRSRHPRRPSDSSGLERSGEEDRRRHRRRRQKSGGRSRSSGHRHRRSESGSDDDETETSYESEDSSRDRKKKRSKRHKSSKRSRKGTSRKMTREGGSRRKRSRGSDSEDSGTRYCATAHAPSGDVAKKEEEEEEEAVIRSGKRRALAEFDHEQKARGESKAREDLRDDLVMERNERHELRLLMVHES